MRLVSRLSPKQLDWRNDATTYPFVRESDLISAERHQDWLDRLSTDRRLRYYGVEENGEIVGTVGLDLGRPEHRTAEYSILIGPEYRGNGHAKKALECLLEHGFDRLGLECIWGEILVTNEAGLAVAKKVGFKEEGRLRKRYYKDGAFVDSVMVSILRDEWKHG